MEKSRHIGRRVALIVVAVVLVLVAVAVIWVNDTYKPDSTARAAMESGNGVTVTEIAGDNVAFVPENPKAGFIFYPGAKVEPEAYAPLMRECAERGVLGVIARMPFNLALLDTNAADGIREQFPEVTEWMISGHSMGGVAASAYASRHEGDFDDIVLLASYSSDDLTGYKGNVLSIVGTNDHVLNLQAYEAASERLPGQARELKIEGGNHANFGSYGVQSGDGEATISPEEQWDQTADAIEGLMKAA